MIGRAEMKRYAGKHPGTHTHIAVVEPYFNDKRASGRVDGRIEQVYFSFKLFLSVHIEFHADRRVLDYSCEITFRDVDQKFYGHDLLDSYHRRSSAKHVATVIVTSGYDTADRTYERRVFEHVLV